MRSPRDDIEAQGPAPAGARPPSSRERAVRQAAAASVAEREAPAGKQAGRPPLAPNAAGQRRSAPTIPSTRARAGSSRPGSSEFGRQSRAGSYDRPASGEGLRARTNSLSPRAKMKTVVNFTPGRIAATGGLYLLGLGAAGAAQYLGYLDFRDISLLSPEAAASIGVIALGNSTLFDENYVLGFLKRATFFYELEPYLKQLCGSHAPESMRRNEGALSYFNAGMLFEIIINQVIKNRIPGSNHSQISKAFETGFSHVCKTFWSAALLNPLTIPSILMAGAYRGAWNFHLWATHNRPLPGLAGKGCEVKGAYKHGLKVLTPLTWSLVILLSPALVYELVTGPFQRLFNRSLRSKYELPLGKYKAGEHRGLLQRPGFYRTLGIFPYAAGVGYLAYRYREPLVARYQRQSMETAVEGVLIAWLALGLCVALTGFVMASLYGLLSGRLFSACSASDDFGDAYLATDAAGNMRQGTGSSVPMNREQFMAHVAGAVGRSAGQGEYNQVPSRPASEELPGPAVVGAGAAVTGHGRTSARRSNAIRTPSPRGAPLAPADGGADALAVAGSRCRPPSGGFGAGEVAPAKEDGPSV